MLQNAEIWFPRLDPKRPNATYNKENPTWELQIRTTDSAQVQEFKALGVVMKPVKYKDDHEDPELAGSFMLTEDGKKQWRVNLRKRSLATDRITLAKPVEVINGAMEAIDPKIIGNGSIANVRVFMRDSEKGPVAVLMGVQVTTLMEYTPSEFEEEESFTVTETKVIAAPKKEATAPAVKGSPAVTAKSPLPADDEF